MKKRILQLLAIVLIFAVSGCGLQKMVDNAKDIDYKVNPNPLEMHAGKVAVEINVTFPPKYFNKKAYLLITPTLVAGDNQIELKKTTLLGEKVKDQGDAIIKYKEGGSYTYRDTIDYDPAFRRSSLELHISAKKGSNGKENTFASVPIADGIITTPELVEKGLIVDNGKLGNTMVGLMRTITPTVELPPARQEKTSLVLYYPLQKAKLDRKEQKKPEIDSFVNQLAQIKANNDYKLQNVTVASYASPDGPVDLNHKLVGGRGDNTNQFMDKKFKKAELQSDDVLKLQRETTPDEDWQGFKKAVQESNIKDKDLILRVLSMYSDPDVREREIKNMAEVYDKLKKEILPKLRRSEIIATYETRQKTPAELISLGKTDPDKLTQTELFYGAQAATGADKETIYKTYIQKYPDDWKAYNNLAVYYLKNNQLDEAEANLQKAENASADNAVVLNNYGALYWAKGDRQKAIEYFHKASKIETNSDINYNLGVVCITKGKYDDAVKKFGAQNSFNKSLAQLLNGSTNDAVGTLNNVKSECAYYYYLKAVEAARNDNAAEVYDNLKKATAKLADLKNYAANDLEFRNYFDDDNFKAIVQ